jgi:hypothetical protein
MINVSETFKVTDSSVDEGSLNDVVINVLPNHEENPISISMHKHYSDQNLQCPRPTQFFRQVSDPVSQVEKSRVFDLENGTRDDADHPNGSKLARKRFVRIVNRMLSDLAGSNRGIADSESIVFGEVIETFYCLVCLENCATKESFTPAACEMKHQYCRNCMCGYAASQLSDGQISVSCPGVNECNCGLNDDEIQGLVTEELFAKYERLKLVKTDINYRECPKCSTGTSDHNSKLPPAITCAGCGYVYCFYHNNAHEGQLCGDYIRNMNRQMRRSIQASEGLVRRTTRLCPACGVPIEKNGGCNHMYAY